MFKKGKRLAALCTIIFVVLSMCMPCLADETQKTIRVGSFEDTFNYVDEHGVRRGYGYELMQALAGYTGWKFEYVKCDWSNCFDKLENGEIDIMGDIAYTDDRAKEMLFSEETMGEEKYVLYADLTNTDILSSDYKSLNGKRIGVVKGAKPEYMLTEWENKHGIHTEHVNVGNNEDVKKKLANDEIGQLKAQINDLYETLLDSISNLELKNKEILRLEKIKYDFFKGASHELKTPLASLKIILENMKYNVGKYKNRDLYIDDCIDLVDHLTKSIQQILSVYSIENLKDDEEIVCIKNELSRVLQKYDVLIHQKELRIQNDVKDETMYIGKTALNIILSNLISNAINYTYEKGMIQIGIEQDYFYIQNKQDPTQPKGNGLGLYIVRNLLDNYKMKYEVIEGEDFIFKIQFKQ
ncbi:transporter substrate-binding domain-containing protein [Holdemanella biformis]|uniref:ATP-binding protein n=1 Tax=Holdemanella biformis TaxID=1735 RepID=UPI0034A07A59